MRLLTVRFLVRVQVGEREGLLEDSVFLKFFLHGSLFSSLMVELADTLGLGSSAHEGVRVRLSVRLLTTILTSISIVVVNRDLLYLCAAGWRSCRGIHSFGWVSDKKPHDYLTVR